MKKKFLLLCLLFVFTGCTAQYKLEISDGTIKEELFIFENEKSLVNVPDDLGMTFKDYAFEYGTSNNIYTDYFNMYGDEENSCNVGAQNNCNVYDTIYFDEEEYNGFKLSTSFNYDNYVNSTVANNLIPNFSFNYDGRYLTISGGSDFDIFDGYKNLNEVKIIIDSAFYTTATNAKYKGNGVYEWIITKENNNLGNMYIIFDTTSTKRLANKNSQNASIIMCAIVGIVILILSIYLFYKKKKNDLI